MKLKDARHMSASAQEALRYRVVNAIANGMSCIRSSQGIRLFHVQQYTIRRKPLQSKGQKH